MPAVYLFNYPDTATEPAEFTALIEGKNQGLHDGPSEEKILKLNELRSRMASLFLSQPNTKAILTAIEEYITALISILPFIEHNKLQNIIKFKWRSSLSASVRTNLSGNFEKPIVKSYSIYYEIIYVHMAYAYVLSNMAIKRVSLDSSDESLNIAIDDLCKAAGIFQNLSVTYASTWTIQDGPPETTPDSLTALADLALGDAQQLACLKAEKRNMSAGTVFKLKAGAISKYDKCHRLVSSIKEDYEDFSRHFKSHIKHVMKFIEAQLLLAMAKNHAEKEEYGNAVAEITASYNLFLECNEAENSNVRAYAKEMLSEAELLHTKYTKFNNSVTYQQVPIFEDLRRDYLSTSKVIVDPKPVVFGNK